MDVFEKRRKTPNPMPLSVKEWMCLLLLLMPVTLGEEQIYLKITNFDPSQVELNCYSDYEGSMNDIFFDVNKAGYSCLTRNSGWCNETHENNCNINCLSAELPEDLESLPFVVNLKGTCDEVLHVGCKIRKAAGEKLLDLEESIQITAQSDPPIIYVNDGQPIEAGPQHVQISCTVTNMCDETELDVSGEVPMLHVNTTHTKTGSRFNTTSTFQAIFYDYGNFTIICQELGRNYQFSRSSVVVAHPSEKALYLKDGTDEYFNPLSIALIPILAIFISSTVILGFVLYFINSRKTMKGRKSDAEEKVPLLAESEKDRYWKIEKTIKQLTHLNIHKFVRTILMLVNEGEITYPEDGHSIIYQMIEKMEDLHREPEYPKLIQDLLPSYQDSALSKKEDLSEIIWTKLKYNLIKDRTEAQECLRKLMIFSLDITLSFRLLWRCALDSIILEEENKLTPHHWIIVRFLIAHFTPKAGKPIDPNVDVKIDASFLEKILEGYVETVKTFDATVKEFDAGVLNFTIQSVPDFILQSDSKNILSIKKFLLGNCYEMLLKTSNELGDHVDEEGRTPLHKVVEKPHNVLEKLNPWMQMSERASGTDSIWNLMPQLISHKNVNIRDKNGVTPYSWILWWNESLPYQDVPDELNLKNKIQEIVELCKKKGASKKDASDGLKILREREIEGLLKMMVKLKMHIIADEENIRKVETKLKRLKELKREGCGECIKGLAVTEYLKTFAQNQIDIWIDKVFEVSQFVLELLIVEDNAQEIYDIVLKKQNWMGNKRENFNYVALFGVLKLSLEKGACPTIAEIYDISLLNVNVCTTREAQLATVKIMENLIVAYRKQGKNEPIPLHFNSFQDQWKISEELRIAAEAVVREAYGTLDNCLKSDSVINILLFLGKDDDIKKCFESVAKLLQRDVTEPPVQKWAEGNRCHNVEADERKAIKEMLIKRNDNWLQRGVLHMAAIFCQDEQVLKCIPEELLVEKEIEGKDVNGYTPLHIACLHENQTAINFFKSRASKSCENLPKTLKSPCTVQYETCCVDIMKNSSVFKVMKSMLILTVNDDAAIGNELKELFEGMLAQDSWYEKTAIGGSVREKLKVGIWNDFNLQIYVKTKPFRQKPLQSLKLREHLVKKLAKIDITTFSLRCISVGDPWKFVWVKDGSCKGLLISVDVMFIFTDMLGVAPNKRKELIIKDAPDRQRLYQFQWNDFMSEPQWQDTLFLHEWDILDNVPPRCRLGVLIAMVLIEAQDQTTPVKFMRNPITTNVLKNTLLWILAGRTPEAIEIKHGNVIAERYGAHLQKLRYKNNDTWWMTEEDLKRYAKDGRFWAETIFDAIEFMAKKYKVTLDCFLTSQFHELKRQHAILVQDICRRCSTQLKPEVFFSGTSGMADQF